MLDTSNKENIKPKQITANASKATNLMSGTMSRPEDMMQTYENFKLLNAQDLLKELNMQQQRLSMKNFSQNLFTTMDTSDIGKRTKTEQNNNHIKSMQTFDTTSNDLDPYNILMTLDSHRHTKSKATTVEDYSKKGLSNNNQ